MPIDSIRLPVTQEPEVSLTPEASSSEPALQRPERGQKIPVAAPSPEMMRLEAENQQLKAALAEAQTQLQQWQQSQNQAQFEAGFQAGVAEAAELIESVAALERHFFENWQQFRTAFEQEVAKIVLAAVGKILGQALVRPETSMAAVKEVLQSVGYQDRLTVYVSEADFKLFERYRRQISPNNSIDYVADDRVAVGGCLVKLDKGMLDGRIEVQLQALIETLSSVPRG